MSIETYDDTPEGAPAVPRSHTSIKADEIKKIRSSSEYRRLREDFRQTCARARQIDGTIGEPCWLCNGDIDYKLAHPHPYAWSLDHAITVKEDPSRILDPLNFRASHYDCNIERGSSEPKLDLGVPSERW